MEPTRYLERNDKQELSDEKRDGRTAWDGRGIMIKAAAGTPVARRGPCDTDYRIAWARDGGLARGVIEPVTQGSTPQEGQGKGKGRLAARRLPWPKHAGPKRVFKRATACWRPGRSKRRDWYVYRPQDSSMSETSRCL